MRLWKQKMKDVSVSCICKLPSIRKILILYYNYLKRDKTIINH